MSIIGVVILLSVFIWYLIVKHINHKNANITISELEEENSELKVSITQATEFETKIRAELSKARAEIWKYELGTHTVEEQHEIDEMKSYIFHLLHKQNAVLGLNDQDKEWIIKLGGEIGNG